MTDLNLFGEIFEEKRLTWLPGAGRKAPEGHVYVVEFSNRIIKVGRTANPRRRIATLGGNAESMGERIVHVWLSEVHCNFEGNERELIAFGQASLGDRIRAEYFVNGASFADFVAVARRLPLKHLDYDAWRAEQDAKVSLFGRVIGAGSSDKVLVSRAYVEAAEQWMSLTNDIAPDGTSRGPLRPIERSNFDECIGWAEDLADATGQSVEDVFEMNWIDMIEGALEAKVATAVMQWRLFAVQNNRTDMTQSCYESWGAA